VVPARGTPRRKRRGDPVAGTHNHCSMYLRSWVPAFAGTTAEYFSSRLLKKTLRIDIDLELEAALGFRRGGEPFAQIGREVVVARRFDQQPEAITPAHHGE